MKAYRYARDMNQRVSQRSAMHWLLFMLLPIFVSGLVFTASPQVIEKHTVAAQSGSPGNSQDPQPEHTAILDRVVAVVDGTAILASDVDEEMRFAVLQPQKEPAADNTPQRALDRLIDRTLIDQQRILQPGLSDVSQKEVEGTIENLRQTIPACANYDCKTNTGWQAFLAAHEFTQQEVQDYIRERLATLKFMDLRFGVAVRVSKADVQKYYDQVFKPELEHGHAAIPELPTVAPRIREVLRQQRISALVEQWLKGLHGDGDVRILDAAYGGAGHENPSKTYSGQGSGK